MVNYTKLLRSRVSGPVEYFGLSVRVVLWACSEPLLELVEALREVVEVEVARSSAAATAACVATSAAAAGVVAGRTRREVLRRLREHQVQV